MRISALLISVVVFLFAGVTSMTCTGETALTVKKPVSVRVRSVAPRAIPKPSSGRSGSSGGGGGRYSSSGGK